MDEKDAEEIAKVYGVPKDDMFVDDYVPDAVESPSHYVLGVPCYQVQEVIKSVLGSDKALEWLSPYEGGQYTGVIERILRAPKKNKLEDLKKAHKQLGWLIDSLEEDE